MVVVEDDPGIADLLDLYLRDAGFRLEDLSGLAYDPVRRKAWVNTRTDINYLACAVKE